jgi:uncharacterized RmlC-like cupin family protein
MNAEQLRVVRASERTEAPGPRTPGMVREQAFIGEDRWVGFVRTEPGVWSGWHHHGDHDTYVYVVRGSIELEFGPGGRERVAGKPGDFALIPQGAVHREGTSPQEPGEAVIVRIGRGQPVINVEGPEPG